MALIALSLSPQDNKNAELDKKLDMLGKEQAGLRLDLEVITPPKGSGGIATGQQLLDVKNLVNSMEMKVVDQAGKTQVSWISLPR